MKSILGRLSLSFITLTLCIFTVNFSVFAQDLDDVIITGKVTDANGAVVVGATVTAILVDQKIERKTTTDQNGRYRIIELQPGNYSIRVNATGFGVQTKTDLNTISAQTLTINFSLVPANVRAEQTISIGDEDAPIIDTTRTIVGTTVTQREVEELPNSSNDVLDLVYTLSGVAEEPLSIRNLADDRRGDGSLSEPTELLEGGVFSLSGGAAYSNNITIDGLDNNDDRSAQERFQPPVDAVAEVQVIKNQFSAEYGRASGGRVNIRTRFGGRKFRGRFSMFYRDDNFNANTYNNNARIPGLPRLPFQEYNPGGTLGGPIPFWYFKDKTYFFSSYSYRDRDATTLIDTVLPVAQNPLYPLPNPTNPGDSRLEEMIDGDNPNPATIAPYIRQVPTPTRRHRFTQRFDHNFTDTHNLTFSYQFGRSKNFRQYRETTRFLEETIQGRVRNNDSFYVTDNYVINSNFVNQFRFQYSNYRPDFATDGGQNPVVLLRVRDEFAPASTRVNGTVVLGNSTTNFASLREETRYQYQDTLNYIVGDHNFRFGFDVQRVESLNSELRDTTGTYNFDRFAEFLDNEVVRYRVRDGLTSLQVNTYTGFFVQHDWRFRSNITLSLGARYERESIIKDNNNWSPRLAVAYSPGDSGNSVIRIGGGIFYNRALLRTIDDFTIDASEIAFDSRDLDGPSRDAFCLNNPTPTDSMSDRCRFLTYLSSQFPNTVSVDDIRALQGTLNVMDGFQDETNFSRRLAPDIVIPESYQFNIGYDRDLGKGFALETNFTFNKTTHLWRETNINAYVLPDGFATYTDYLISLGTVNVNGNMYAFELAGANAPDTRTGGGGETVVNLNSTSNSAAVGEPLRIARDTIDFLLNRGFDNNLGQVEQVGSIGRSVYEGLSFVLRRRLRPLGYGFRSSMRFSYTLSRTRDDGIVNTSSAQTAGDFASEFSPSVQDRNHRFRMTGTMELPDWMGKFRLSPLLRVESARPFNLSIGGNDRNLDDVSNDRPNFRGHLSDLRSREPGSAFPFTLADQFSLAPIGSPGNLPRNAGRGPMLFIFDLNITRQFKFNERFRIRPHVEFDNILNATVYSFGSDFINFNNINDPDFQDEFLVPSRTFRPRQIRFGVRVDF